MGAAEVAIMEGNVLDPNYLPCPGGPCVEGDRT